MNSQGAEPARRPYRMTARADAAEATATRVLDVALELFTEQDFDDVSLELVAERVGISKRTVIRRFGSKEALFVATMNRGVAEAMRQRDEAPVGDVAGAVRNVLDSYEWWGRNRLRFIAQEDRIPLIKENVEGGRHYHRAWVERIFAPQLGERSGEDRERRVRGLLVLTDVYTWKLLRLDHGLSRTEVETTLIELINALNGERT